MIRSHSPEIPGMDLISVCHPGKYLIKLASNVAQKLWKCSHSSGIDTLLLTSVWESQGENTHGPHFENHYIGLEQSDKLLCRAVCCLLPTWLLSLPPTLPSSHSVLSFLSLCHHLPLNALSKLYLHPNLPLLLFFSKYVGTFYLIATLRQTWAMIEPSGNTYCPLSCNALPVRWRREGALITYHLGVYYISFIHNFSLSEQHCQSLFCFLNM